MHARVTHARACTFVSQVDSDKFMLHLEDTNKLANHLAPMITEFSKMSLAFQEMTAAQQQSSRRIEDLEKKVNELEIRNKALEKNSQQSNEKKKAVLESKSGEHEMLIGTLQGKVEVIENGLKPLTSLDLYYEVCK